MAERSELAHPPRPTQPVSPISDLPADSAVMAYSQGRKLIEESEFKEAVKRFTEAVQLSPTFALAFNSRAYANIRLGRYAEALRDLERALELNPRYANALQNRSAARKRLGDKAGAAADLVKANELLGLRTRAQTSIFGNDAASPNIWPVPGRVTGGFGKRIDPISGEGAFHNGLDIGAQTGDPVHCTADGVVVRASGNTEGYGRLVVVDHRGGAQTWYAHLGHINVTVGQDVYQGQVIGAAGSSGRVTAPHLHYEVRVAGVPRDPSRYLSRQPWRALAQVHR